MRIILTAIEPPDPTGHPGRAWIHALVSGLAERGHDVSFFCVATGPAAEAARQVLSRLPIDFEICEPVRKKRPLLKKLEHFRRPFVGTIPRELWCGVERARRRGYDVLHFEYAGHAHVGMGLPRSLISVHGLARVDARGRGFQSWRAFSDRMMGIYGETLILRASPHIRVLTDRLGAMVKRIVPGATTYTVPLALDPDRYPVVGGRAGGRTVGFIGDVRGGQAHRAALRLITSIWPKVRRRAPDARLLVAGWGTSTVLAEFADEPGVTLWDSVPHGTAFFEQCSVFAFPCLDASGLHSKTMETMAYGVPMVSTSEGMEGVPAEQGVHAYVEDDDAGFAERVAELLGSPADRRRMAEAARALLVEQFSPCRVLDQMEAMYRQVARA
jgi:glycosyltransferase involved in cell wall biosynthesis